MRPLPGDDAQPPGADRIGDRRGFRYRPGAVVDALLAAKTHVPAPRPGWVGRPERLAVLNAEPGARLVTVVAGAGYGKSTLLAL